MLRALYLAAPLLLIAAAPASQPDKPICSRIGDGLQSVVSRGQAKVQRLDQLPPANEYLTVLRSENGCQKPVIVRYDVGGSKR